MAPGDMVPDHAKPLKPKEKRPGPRALKAECEPDGSFVFEAHEAWKEFHNSLRHFYEVGELCDVTLKVGSVCPVPADVGTPLGSQTTVRTRVTISKIMLQEGDYLSFHFEF